MVGRDSSESPEFFGEWVKRRRKALDMTQEELAYRAGCSKFTMRKIESGERRPSKQLAALLASALEIPEDQNQNFIRVARGETLLERMNTPLPDTSFTTYLELKTSASPSQIPLQFKPLLGRESELSAMEKLFNDPQCRLLTLTGMGGIGKTSLATEFATRQHTSNTRSVYYAPLASVNSVEAVIPTIADTLGFVFSGSNIPKEQLINYIAHQLKQSVLIVLDNLEHLLIHPSDNEKTGVAELIAEFLRRLPNVKILATSREPLNIQGEWTYELHGLPIPPLDYEGSLEEYPAASLFIQSAQRANVDFVVTDKDRPALIRICYLLDGIPLAVELAAAWTGMLSCHEIAQEIDSNIDFLTTSMRDVPERHRSIRASIDHSWKLLSGEEQRVLRHLSVFQGGFDRRAAEFIVGATLPLLASLVTKSLVRRTDQGHYDLHPVIRQYALSYFKVDPDSDNICACHGEYYLELLKSQECLLKSDSQQNATRTLTGEIDNIYAAWAWAIEQENFDLLYQAGRAFGWYFEIAGLYSEGIEQLELLLKALKASTHASQWENLIGLAHLHQALLYFRKGDFIHARSLYEECVVTFHRTGNEILLMDALIFLGVILHLGGEYSRAKTLVDEGLVLAQTNGDLFFEAYAIYNLGYIASLTGRYEEGYEQMLIGLDKWRAVGDPHYISLGLNFMVPTLIQLGRYEEAKTYMHESIALCEHSRNRWGMGTAYRYLGLAHIGAKQYAEAQAHILKSLEIFGKFTEGWDIARSLTYLGDGAMLAGDLPEARRIYQDALQAAIDAKALPIALDAIFGIGNLLSLVGEHESALMYCDFILNHPSCESETKVRASQLHEALLQKLEDDHYQALRSEVQAKTFDQLVAHAMTTT